MPAPTSNSALGIIRDGMVDAGLLGEGDDPNSDQLASNLRRLNDIINLWQTQGIKLFLQEEITVDMLAGTSTYTIIPPTTTPPNKNLRILQARVEDEDGNKRDIPFSSWNEWNTLSVGPAGPVVRLLVVKETNSLRVKLWPIPDTTEAENDLILLVHRQVNNPINLLETMEFPQEWRIALRWGLADDICTGQPQAIMDRCKKNAETYRQMLEDWDVEDTETRFTPNYPVGYMAGSFT